jgi:signal peptidase II
VPSADADRRRLRQRRLLVAGIVVAVIALDQATKAWAASGLRDSPVSVIGSTVEFQLARNTGSAFSLFQTVTPLLAVLAVALVAVLVRTLNRTEDRMVLVALALVLGGALGNVSDRLFRAPGFLHGAVVDFIKVGSWPTFNVADSAITIGAVLLVVWSLLSSRSGAAPDP